MTTTLRTTTGTTGGTQHTTAPSAATSDTGRDPTRRGTHLRWATLPLGLGGLSMAAGGQLHPHGSGATVDAYLASMLGSPTWLPSHLLLLLGTMLATIGFVTTRRAEVFGPLVERWLVAATVGWGVAAVELVPHLVAVQDADGLAHHHATPVLDLHLALQVVATPLLGLTGAALAIAVARSAPTWPARLLAVPAVVGGLGYAASAPLIAATASLAPTVLFPMQAGLALWLVATCVRVVARNGPSAAPTEPRRGRRRSPPGSAPCPARDGSP